MKLGLEKELKVRKMHIFLVYEVFQVFRFIIQYCGHDKMIEEMERK